MELFDNNGHLTDKALRAYQQEVLSADQVQLVEQHLLVDYEADDHDCFQRLFKMLDEEDKHAPTIVIPYNPQDHPDALLVDDLLSGNLDRMVAHRVVLHICSCQECQKEIGSQLRRRLSILSAKPDLRSVLLDQCGLSEDDIRLLRTPRAELSLPAMVKRAVLIIQLKQPPQRESNDRAPET